MLKNWEKYKKKIIYGAFYYIYVSSADLWFKDKGTIYFNNSQLWYEPKISINMVTAALCVPKWRKNVY